MAVSVPTARIRPPAAGPEHQEIRFCRASDGVRLAWAVHGSGPPVVVVSCWLSHLQHDWQSPVWRHFLEDLGEISTLVRYDERGFGMSDWNVTDFSLEARLRDLDAVIAATGLERFALLGMSGGSPVAMAYAAAHPERVTRLILYGTSTPRSRHSTPERDAEEAVYRDMIRVGWAKKDPTFRRVFTSFFLPNASERQLGWFDDLQRMSTSPENAVASRIARQAIDVTDRLTAISAPTLILQAVNDRATGFEPGAYVASRIAGARLVALDSANHILLADEPSWPVFMSEVTAFLEPDRAAAAGAGRAMAELSPRERDVVLAAAEGLANADIAARLGLSVRTVERHLSNVYQKLGLNGPSARAAAVAEVVRSAR
jgi:pimeloyl-ACP methyl ester carboxylesterase/DNA-binding CsgD family transcriptional regulator